MKFLFTLLILIPATLCAQNKVGINTTSPASDLDIRGDDDTWDGGELQLATPSMSNFIRMFGGRLGDRNPFLAFSDQDTFHFVTTTPDWSNFSRRISISPNGNLGIGVTSPLHRLSIKGNSNATAAVLKAETTYLGSVHVHGIEGVALPAAGFGKGGHFTGGGRGVQAWAEGGSSTELVIGVEGTALGTAGTRVGVFGRALGGATNWAGYFDEGNVYIKGRSGVGTLNPNARMHLQENSSTSLPQLRLTETSNQDFTRIKFENANEPGVFWDIAALADSSAALSKINFYYSHPGSAGDKMTITGEGNVGIGTTSPANRLRVNGSTSSNQHVFSAGTNYSGNVHVRAIEGFSSPSPGYGIGGFLQGGSKGLESIGNGGNFSGTVTGVEGYALGSGGTRIGIYGWATGGSTNWAGRFGQGNVWIENNARIDGDVGIGTASPATRLDVNGKIKVANDADVAQAGMIRFNTTTNDFEGFDGNEWLSLTSKGLSDGWGKPVAAVVENQQGFTTDGTSEDEFGRALSFSGSYAIIGAPFHNTNGNDDQGKAYIFYFDGMSEYQQAILSASDGMTFDNFGKSVATDGNYAVVGASGHAVGGNAEQGQVYVFVRNGTTWTQQAILTASDGAAEDKFGVSVSIHSDFILVGASGCDYGGHINKGKVYVYERNGTNWIEYAILTPPDGWAGDAFGTAVAISGTYALAGAPLHDTYGLPNSGKAYVYNWNGTGWLHEGTLITDDGDAGDLFGDVVAISGDYAVIGSSGHDPMGYGNKGSVYLYTRNGSNWPQTSKLTAFDGKAGDRFGQSISIDGNNILIGAPQPYPGSGIGPGRAYLYSRTGSTWVYRATLSAADGQVNDEFGGSVGISGSLCVVGAPEHDMASETNRGKAYFFKKD